MLDSILLAAVLSSGVMLDPPAQPPAGGGDILRGPEVPADSLKPEKDRKKTDADEKASRPVLEQRVLFAALDGLKLDDAKRAKVKKIQADFEASVTEWMKASDAKRKELFEKRKKTPTGDPVSDEFKKGMEEIEAKRPKLSSVKDQLTKVLDRSELEQLRTAYAEGLKRAQQELTKRTEAERAKQAEERKKKSQEMEKDGGSGEGGSGEGGSGKGDAKPGA